MYYVNLKFTYTNNLCAKIHSVSQYKVTQHSKQACTGLSRAEIEDDNEDIFTLESCVAEISPWPVTHEHRAVCISPDFETKTQSQ